MIMMRCLAFGENSNQLGPFCEWLMQVVQAPASESILWPVYVSFVSVRAPRKGPRETRFADTLSPFLSLSRSLHAYVDKVVKSCALVRIAWIDVN